MSAPRPRLVHVRSVRPARRQYTPNGAKASDRRWQVRALCGAWVLRVDAVRIDRPGCVTCPDCEVRS